MLCACEKRGSSNSGNLGQGTGGQSQGSSNCQDKNSQCAAWAGMGECSRNPKYMLSNCQRSCNACSSSSSNTPESTSLNCRDNNAQQCPLWASGGECSRNPAYMNVNCKRSCGRC